MRQARAVVREVLDGGEPVYGLTTGVGERKMFPLDPAERLRFNRRLVLNHRIAQGDAAPADVVRGTLPADLEPIVELVIGGLTPSAPGRVSCLDPRLP